MKKFLLVCLVLALILWAVCFGLAYAGWIPDSKAFMDSLELFGAASAFFGFPLLGAGLFKFMRGFVSVEDLKSFEERIKKKISKALPAGNNGRQDNGNGFEVYFTKDPDGVLTRFYDGNGREWGDSNYLCLDNQAAIRHRLCTIPDDVWIVCASQDQRFVTNDPTDLGDIQFTEAEKEIMKLIPKHSK